MFATFILVLFYRYDRVTASLWIRYPGILLGGGLQLASVPLQIILWLRNVNTVEETQEALDVVTGMFSINDTSVVVLFDSRASHSEGPEKVTRGG
jgi:hypothetical protein